MSQTGEKDKKRKDLDVPSLTDDHKISPSKKRKFDQKQKLAEKLKSLNVEKHTQTNPESPIPLSPLVSKVGIQLIKNIQNSVVLERQIDSNITNPIKTANSIRLQWDSAPKTVYIVKKYNDTRVTEWFLNMSKWLLNEKKMIVYVEPDVYNEFKDTLGVITYSSEEKQKLHRLIDLVICLGGDGTFLHTAMQFNNAVPPIISYCLGSVGFLTSFDINDYQKSITQVLNGDVHITLRMRLNCKIIRSDGSIEKERVNVLNEVVIDRGQSPFLTSLECFCNDTHVTTIQADGVIIATPTGSTAYSMSAGGSMVHPHVGCMLLTPICPHSLSFRPIVLPDSTVLKIKVPDTSRGSAWCAFDGRKRKELRRGDALEIKTSIWPVPAICNFDNNDTTEWFARLAECLNWNVRKTQNPL